MVSLTAGKRSDRLVAFFALTFAITWGIAAFLVLFPSQMKTWFGAFSAHHPLFFLAVCAPSLAAMLTTASTEGRAGLWTLLRRSFYWRFGLQWYLLVLLGVPLLGLSAAFWGGDRSAYDSIHWGWFIPALFSRLFTDPGALGEELGWRGYALPRLLKGRSALSASLMLGVIWFVWHLPAFFINGTPQISLSLPAFFFGALALSILATWLVRQTQGSLILSILLHLMVNFSLDLLGAPLVWLSSLLALCALLVVIQSRDDWFGGSSADVRHFSQALHDSRS